MNECKNLSDFKISELCVEVCDETLRGCMCKCVWETWMEIEEEGWF